MLNSIDLKQLFFYVAIPSTLVLIIQTVITILGLSLDSDFDIDSDVDLDTDIDFDTDADFDTSAISSLHGLRFFSIRGLLAFFTVFGWVGVSLCNTSLPRLVIIFIALLCGLISMFIIALLFLWITRLQSNGLLNLKNALGKTCEIYLTIPANRNGMGKINVMIQDRYVEFDAVTDDNENISTGSQARVIDISGNNILVITKEKY
ncbi:hypothetical protein PV797_20715 [Clostridiaceae bacterium M8S5]|nr:hypothetical protein PV797_20715 [Clostridiaceae bacterium M8S5]